jgi:hypothetical protein
MQLKYCTKTATCEYMIGIVVWSGCASGMTRLVRLASSLPLSVDCLVAILGAVC